MIDFIGLEDRQRPRSIVEALNHLARLRSMSWGPYDDQDGHLASAKKSLLDAIHRELVEPLLRDAGRTPEERVLELTFASLAEQFYRQHLTIGDEWARGHFDEPGCRMLLRITKEMRGLHAAIRKGSGRGRPPHGRRRR